MTQEHDRSGPVKGQEAGERDAQHTLDLLDQIDRNQEKVRKHSDMVSRTTAELREILLDIRSRIRVDSFPGSPG